MPTAVDGSPTSAARPPLWRITDRRSFDDLRRRGRRGRRGCVTVTFVPPGPDASPGLPPRVGFAVGRQVGGAVVRNRIRRRLRAALRQLLTDGSLPSGTYLVGATVVGATMAWPQLLGELAEAVAEVTR